MPIRAVLFDFDGTLADSFLAITSSTNHVRRTFGLPPLSEDVVRENVGFGLPHLMRELVPTVDTVEAVACYAAHHEGTMAASTRLMPGVAETLPALHQRGLRMAVCSNKRVEFTKRLTESLGMHQYFSAVLGPENVAGQAKPDPAMLLEALRQLEVTHSETVYVGDMAIDIHTGKAAGIPVWLVPGGATGRESPLAAGPDRVLTGFADLLPLLRSE